jgi:hypothetical protein
MLVAAAPMATQTLEADRGRNRLAPTASNAPMLTATKAEVTMAATNSMVKSAASE